MEGLTYQISHAQGEHQDEANDAHCPLEPVQVRDIR